MAQCKSCGRQIDFIKTINGKFMPVNAEYLYIFPDVQGDVIAVTDDGKVIAGNQTMAGAQGALRGRISHFATCPAADKYRSKNKAKSGGVA